MFCPIVFHRVALLPRCFGLLFRLNLVPLTNFRGTGQTQPSQSASVSIVAQQQLMNKTMEKQSELQLDKSRVTLLLEINAELLREVLKVQPKFGSPEEAKTDPVFREYAVTRVR